MRILSMLSGISMVSLLSVAALSGCAVEGTEADDELAGDVIGDANAALPVDKVGEVSQQVSAIGFYDYYCDTFTCNFDIGSTTGRTCFLAGVWGSLEYGAASIYPIVGGTYRLHLAHSFGNKIGARAICISGTTNRTYASWRGGDPALQINGTVTAQRRCLLTGISNESGSTNGFDNTSDYAEVWKDSAGKWYVGGSLSGGADSFVSSVCVDIPTDRGLWGIVANPGGSVGFNLAYNASGGVACGLKKLGGKFTAASFTNGVDVGYNSGSRYWNVSADDGKSATLVCYE